MNAYQYIVSVGLLLALGGCSSLDDQAIYNMAAKNSSIKDMVQSVAAVDGYAIKQYKPGQYSVQVSRKKIDPRKFRPLLRIQCEQKYGGTLTTEKDDPLFVGVGIPLARLQRMASSEEGSVEFLRAELASRSMVKHVVYENRQLAKKLVEHNKKLKKAFTLSRGVCVSYKEGLIQMHFSAALLSKDPLSGSADTFWAVTEKSVFLGSVKQEMKHARIRAERLMLNNRSVSIDE